MIGACSDPGTGPDGRASLPLASQCGKGVARLDRLVMTEAVGKIASTTRTYWKLEVGARARYATGGVSA